MKTVICHTDFRIYWPPRLMALAEYLKNRECELRVIEIAGKGSPYAFAEKSVSKEFWTCLFPRKKMEDIPAKVASAGLYSELDKVQPDIVISGPIAYPSGATAVRWACNRKRPVVIMDDARLEDLQHSFMVNLVKRRIYANVDALLIPAPSHVPDYKHWGISEKQMFFGVDVVDNQFFTLRSDAARKKAEVIRKQYSLPSRFILGVGRQVQKKNWQALIQAFASIHKASKWGLVLVGDGQEAEKLNHAAVEAKGNIVFLPFQNQENLCEIYGVADCFVLPSLYGETWGLVVNEAMACRLPVIVSQECGCAETLVRDGYNGWQFDPHDIGQLASIMKEFIQLSEDKTRKMGQKSFEIVSDWGLNRFCEGIWQAIQFCRSKPAHSYALPLIDRIILNLWKGRYRPT